jgi:hypothetical protein
MYRSPQAESNAKALAYQGVFVAEGVTPAFFLDSVNASQFQRLAAGFKNPNLVYLYWCDSRRKFENDFVLRVTGRLPITPYGLYNDTKVRSSGLQEPLVLAPC